VALVLSPTTKWLMSWSPASSKSQEHDVHAADRAQLNRQAVALRSALQRPMSADDAAAAQTSLATISLRLADGQWDTREIEAAVVTLRRVIAEHPREQAPELWARAQLCLGAALLQLGEREPTTARLEEAVVTLRAALLEHTPRQPARETAAPERRAALRNLGKALSTLGERTADRPMLREAGAALRDSLVGLTPESDPSAWAVAHANLGAVLTRLGQLEGSQSELQEAVSAYRSALEASSPERSPSDWSLAMHGLGSAQLALSRSPPTARYSSKLPRPSSKS